MSSQPTDKPQGKQSVPSTHAQQQSQKGANQPNRNVVAPKFQYVTEGYNPRANVPRTTK